MKKIYMQPLTEVVKINIEQMLIDSGVKGVITSEEPGLEKADKVENPFFDSDLW